MIIQFAHLDDHSRANVEYQEQNAHDRPEVSMTLIAFSVNAHLLLR